MADELTETKTFKELISDIISSPTKFKVCCGCERLVPKDTVHCPYCHSYRYAEDIDSVVNQALNFANSPEISLFRQDEKN